MTATRDETAAQDIAELIAEMRDRIERLERGPRLRRASIDEGSLEVRDSGQETRQVIGQQPDGTYTTVDVNGPQPPMPSGVTADPGVESAVVRWSGSATAALPADFARVGIHISKVTGYVPTEATEVAAFGSPIGGIAYLPADAGVRYYVRLVMVSTSGVWSEPTAEIEVIPTAPDTTEPVQPTVSPTPEAFGMKDGVLLKWSGIANDTPVEYEVHVSTVAGFNAAAGDPATLYARTAGTMAVVTALPAAAGGAPLEYGPEDDPTLYYFRIIAVNEAGPAPAGGQAEGSRNRTAQGDLVAESVLAAVVEAINAEFGNSLTVGAPGGRQIVLDLAEGFRIVGQDGTNLVHMPTDPADDITVRAKVIASFLEALGGLTIRGPVNEITSGAIVTLVGGVSDPRTPPDVQTYWDYTQHTPAPNTDPNIPGSYGLTYLPATDEYVTAHRDSPATPALWWWDGFGKRLRRFTGMNPNYQPDSVVYDPVADRLRVLVWARSQGGSLRTWETRLATDGSGDGRDTSDFWPTNGIGAAGWDHVENYTLGAAHAGVDAVHIYQFTFAAGSEFSMRRHWYVDAFDGDPPISYVARGSFDFGGGDYLILGARTTGEIRVYQVSLASTVTGAMYLSESARRPDLEWVAAASMWITGMCWNTEISVFESFNNSGQRYYYEPGTKGIGYAQDIRASYASYDANTAGSIPAGQTVATHETRPSPESPPSIMYRRQRLTVIAPPPNSRGGTDDPTHQRIYLRLGAEPTTDALFAQTWLQGQTASGILTVSNFLSGAGVANPKTVNNFPAGIPGVLRSVVGGFEVRGDGTGAWPFVQPVGVILPYSGATEPPGWLFANGQPVSRSLYPALHAMAQAVNYAAPWGPGDGINTFNVPNGADKFLIGVTAGKPLGATGGAHTRVIGANNLPPHQHGMGHPHPDTASTGGGHTHDYTWRQSAAQGGTQDNVMAAGGTAGTVVSKQVASASGSGHPHTIPRHEGDTGTGVGLSNDPLTVTPPWLAVNYIIKT